MLTKLEHCLHSAEWLANLGRKLNAQRRYAEAAEHLERSLLLNPTALIAAFDYSVALAGTGDLSAATSLLEQLLQREDLPASVKTELVAAQTKLAGTLGTTPVQPGWQTQQTLSLRLGHETNMLGSPRLDSLTLTTPGGDVTLPLETGSGPTGGHYLRTDWRVDATHTQHNGRQWTLSAAAQHRQVPSLRAANSTQLEAQLETLPSSQHPGGGAWLNLNTSHLQTPGGTLYKTHTALGGWAWGHAQHLRAGAEWQARHLVSNPLLSGTYTGAHLRWHQQGYNNTHWQLHARLGTDHPNNPTRPGGQQHLAAVRAAVRWQLWLLEAEWQRTSDRAGYSPLLDNNRVRQTTRNLLRVERTFPFGPPNHNLQSVVGVERYWQSSNLQIFKTNSTQGYVILRMHWN